MVDYLTAQQAADALGKTKQTVINRINNKKITGVKGLDGEYQINASIFYAQYPNAKRIIDGQVSKLDGEQSNFDTRQSQNLTNFDSDLTVKLKEELAAERARVQGLEEQLRREREIAQEARNDKLRAEELATKAQAIAAALTDQRNEEEKARQRRLDAAEEAKRKRYEALTKAQQDYDALPFWKKWGVDRPA